MQRLTSSPPWNDGDSQTSRFRFLFLSLAGISQLPFGLMPIRSYGSSTDFHRKPCGENIIGGIDVSVVVRPTFWTIPFPNIKRQFINNVTAVSTTFRAGKPSVNLHQCPTVPLAFVFQLTNHERPRSISNRLRQFVVFQHILHRQVFDLGTLAKPKYGFVRGIRTLNIQCVFS